MPWPRSIAILAIACSAGTLLSGCGRSEAEGGMQMPPAAVSVATPLRQDVQPVREYSGRLVAEHAVELRPRVSGYLASLHFREGAQVAKGELLFQIDARELQAARAAAAADLVRARARLDRAEHEHRRSRPLAREAAISQSELEQADNERAQAGADLAAAKARLQQAELELGFAALRAPISGRMGLAAVKPGNLVTADQTLLATLVAEDPLYVEFHADEAAFLQFRSGGEVERQVRFALNGETGFDREAELALVDNALDPATGTVRMRARLANPDGHLSPGLFARVRWFGSTEADRLLIHEQALLTDQDRRYVYIVGDGSVAQRQDLQLGASLDGLRVVESGLNADSQVVVNGMRKIFFPGQPLQPVTVDMREPNAVPAQPESPLHE